MLMKFFFGSSAVRSRYEGKNGAQEIIDCSTINKPVGDGLKASRRFWYTDTYWQFASIRIASRQGIERCDFRPKDPTFPANSSWLATKDGLSFSVELVFRELRQDCVTL
ncbi:hypothetical protein ASG57_10795 [Bradyrhizobium sp. Leaf396]|nr:hypothetical protein ASG57_10795 [Bradyrhizobium sp. Leaf396]